MPEINLPEVKLPTVKLPDGLRDMSRDDIVKFHRRYAPGSCVLVVVGDVWPSSLQARIGSVFNDWKPEGPPAKDDPLPFPAYRQATTIALIDQPGATLSSIVVGMPSPGPTSHELPQLMVANGVFAGGAFARLNTNPALRREPFSRVSSAIDGRRFSAALSVRIQVPADMTVAALNAFYSELDALMGREPEEQEVQTAQAALLGGLSLRVQSAAQLADMLVDMSVFGQPPNYWTSFQTEARATLPRDVRRLMNYVWLDASALTIAISGDAAKLASPLRALGKGTVVLVNAEGVGL